ncbi:MULTISPECIES: pyridoxamine 5'-phosphate oxidase family protein [Paenibacillus]|uniref:pyridoxamine 5'-phosphate oxidase family protein n=1 Tax=Paenibacillus TaxID=44249 RepID=UPI00203F812E|nr:pyridoxamine 5'-phosphate oxidase family protein [Paenibacillus camelliae]MCM3633685.1 pyridoxamine 5'-phosphate oxidase family protein [Paenibacillus camelliae]
MNSIFRNVIETFEEFNELQAELGQPSNVVSNKVIHSLESTSKDFISNSPFIVIATSDGKGRCDASPRGDRPGFVHIIDEKHLFIPERPGNRKMDSIQNILQNPHIGIIFIIPGMDETFRVNGRACISRDEALLSKTAVNGKLPKMGIGVEIEECYMHCGKAFKRSGLWDAEQWLPKNELPSASKIIAAHVSEKMQVTADQIEKSLEDTYKNRLY